MKIEKQLESVLKKSKILPERRKVLMDNFDFLSAEQKVVFVNILRDSTHREILEFIDLMMHKIDVLKNGTMDDWRKILREEFNF